MKYLGSSIIKASKKVLASSGNSPIALGKRILEVVQQEGLRGFINRSWLWLCLSGAQPIKSRHWLEIHTYPSQKKADGSGTCDEQLKVSVIVPNFNHAQYLPKRLQSIANQTYTNTEYILLDDRSSDNSRDILTQFAERHPDKTTCLFNERNSGGVFHQWAAGFAAAKGELIWIAESDDYCTENFLEELVVAFCNPAIRIAFCRTEFVRGIDEDPVWNKHGGGFDIWRNKFVASAHALTKQAWVMMNIIPNVSGAIFRHPGNLTLLEDPTWRSMRLCGDWIFFTSLARGGLVAYNPEPTNYYRQHTYNTSVTAQKEEIYYREHQLVQSYLQRLYHLEPEDLSRLENYVYRHWCIHHGISSKKKFELFFAAPPPSSASSGKEYLNIAIITYALIGGGGETLPLMLANLLHQRGHAVTVIDFNQLPSEPTVKKMLSREIPLLTLENPLLLRSILSDMAIDVVHSHHAWVDMTVASLLTGNSSCKHLVTLHGMYEMMTPELFSNLRDSLEQVDQFAYTAEKNLAPFSRDFQSRKHFVRINNAVLAEACEPIARSELGIGAGDFVLCFVARGRPDKGWQEAIEAVLLANERSQRDIHLLLIGDGEEPKRLQPIHKGNKHLHFLGFQGQIRRYFGCADMGFIPSRFQGESAPLVLIDSLMTGKPVLASDIGEIQMMLQTEAGLAGEVFALRDWQIAIESLAEIIHNLADDRAYFDSLAGRVPAAARKFDPLVMVETYEGVYRELCKESIKNP